MVDQSNTDAAYLPPPSASDIPASMLKESSSSHTLVANRGTKQMTGNSNFTILISFWFHLLSTTLPPKSYQPA
jgi:hypothetical protein